MIYKLVVVAVIAIGTSAFATQERLPPATADQIELARAHADRMIAAAGTPTAFSNVTAGAFAGVLHVRSNMLCLIDPDDPTEFVRVLDANNSLVSCGDSDRGQERFTLAYLLPEAATTRQILDGFGRIVRESYPDATLEGNFSGTEIEGLEQAQGAVFNATFEGRDIVSIIMATQHEGWAYITVVSGDAERRDWHMITAQVRSLVVQDHFRTPGR